MTQQSTLEANPPTHVIGQFYSWSDGERCALGLVIERARNTSRASEAEQPKVVVFRWGAWPRQAALPPAPQEPQEESTTRELTSQQVAVMRLVVGGKSNIEIGESLGLSHRTIKFHIRNVTKRLGCTSRNEAAARFLGRGAPR